MNNLFSVNSMSFYIMKGIILAGGLGTRLYPSTRVISKQLMCLYNKPMIYYPLSVLMIAGIREILIITNNQHNIDSFKELFGNGELLGLEIAYKIQSEPRGLADAFIVGEEFIGGSSVCMILGDNFFYGDEFFSDINKNNFADDHGAKVFAYKVDHPENYGVIEFNKDYQVLSIEEKPKSPKSPYALTGIYYFDKSVVQRAKSLVASARGELEIVDLIKLYLSESKCKVKVLGKGTCWFDTGNFSDMLDASNFVAVVEKRQGQMLGCLEEIAYNLNYIDLKKLKEGYERVCKSEYGHYLMDFIHSLK